MKIESVKIKIEVEPDPDITYLGEYTDMIPEQAHGYQVIQLYKGTEPRPREFQYFIAANVTTVEQAVENYNRYREYGETWHQVYVYAEAIVSYQHPSGGRRLTQFTSAGIGGVDADDDRYLEIIKTEELNDLREHLTKFGIDPGGPLHATN